MPVPPPKPKEGENLAPIVVFWRALVEWFDDFLDLREGMDRQGAIDSIKQGKFMRGSNAWMLVCSIMIASLGLNLNSGAVIIGAMLISPLMNPILGVGLGVATNDREMLVAAVRHFFIAIAIAVITSVLYFWLTPIQEFTEEMKSRTAPTFLDGMVAIFGGLAGIISVTRADKTNAIPGVAIATALMPPLCVSGYGITVGFSTGDWNIALRSFYLFFLNSFFIAATAYLIIRILRFPYRTYMNEKESRRSRLLIGLFSILIIIPGIIILREVLHDLRAKKVVREFIEEEFPVSCVEYRLIPVNRDSNLLVMELINREVEPDSVRYFEKLLRNRSEHLGKLGILAIPDNTVSLRRIEQQQRQISSLSTKNNQMETLQQLQEKAQLDQAEMKSELNVYRRDTADFSALVQQLRLAFPRVMEVAISRAQVQRDTTFLDGLPMVVIRREEGGTRRERTEELSRMEDYLKVALREDTLRLLEY